MRRARTEAPFSKDPTGRAKPILNEQACNMTVKLLTTGLIAEKLRTTPERIRYIALRRMIEASAMAGNTKLYDNAALARIRYELNAIDAKRAVRKEVTP